MSDRCDLRVAAGEADEACLEERCAFWRAVDHLGEPVEGSGCAIKHFRLLGNEEMVAWLISVKERVEANEGASA